jgi:uncharacterized phiE125 gp8 family phage protein
MEPMPAAVVAAAADAVRMLLRLEQGNEEAVVARVAATALGLAESFCAQRLITREGRERLIGGGDWRALGLVPVRTILSVADADGVAVPSDSARIDDDGRCWIRAEGVVVVRCRVGLVEEWDGLPPEIAHGVAIMGAHLFDNRAASAEPPAAVAALWRPWRRMRLDARRAWAA